MKFLRHKYRHFENDWKNRVIFIQDNLDDEDVIKPKKEEDEIKKPEEEIDEILKDSLLTFSVPKLKRLEELSSEFNNKQKTKFQEIIRYCLNSYADSESMSFGILSLLNTGQVPGVNKFLTLDMQNRIREVLRISEILSESLLTFSVSKLKELNKLSSSFNERQKAKFREVIGYYLSLASDPEGMPPRILALLHTGQASKVRKFLSLNMQNRVREILDEKRQRLDEFLKKPSERWTTMQTSRVCTLYKFVRASAVTEEGKLDDIFERTQKELIKKAVPLAHQFVATEMPAGKTEKIISTDKKARNLFSNEKVLALEVHRLFPNREDWGWGEHKERWDLLWEGLVDSIASSLSDESKKKDDPNFILSWELLEDWVSNDNLWRDNNLERYAQIQKLIKRGNAAQFLRFAEKQKVLLPMHLKLLDEILENKDEFLLPPSQTNEEYLWDVIKKDNPETETEEKYQRNFNLQRNIKGNIRNYFAYIERGDLQNDLRASKGKNDKDDKELDNLINALNGFVFKLKRREPGELEPFLSELEGILGVREHLLEGIMKVDQFLALCDDFRKRKREVASLEGELLKVKGEKESLLEEQDQELNEKLEPLIEEKDKLEEKKTNLEANTLEKFLKGQSKDPLIEKYRKVQEEIEDAGTIDDQEEKEKELEEIKEEILLKSAEHREASRKIKEEIGTLESKIYELKFGNVEMVNWNKYLTKSASIATEIEKDYWKNLEGRIRSRRIRAADLSVLWQVRELKFENVDSSTVEVGDKVQWTQGGVVEPLVVTDVLEGHVTVKGLNTDIPIDQISLVEKRKELSVEFREKFEAVLDKKIESAKTRLNVISVGLSDEDKYSEWFKVLDEEFSYESFATGLEEEGFSLKDKFITKGADNQQIRTELILGGLQHHRDKITREVSSSMGEDKEEKEEFFTEWERLHSKVSSPSELTDLNSDLKYSQDKMESAGKIIEESRKKTEAFSEGFISDDRLKASLRKYGTEEKDIENQVELIKDICLELKEKCKEKKKTSYSYLFNEFLSVTNEQNIGIGRVETDELINQILLDQTSEVVEKQCMDGFWEKHGESPTHQEIEELENKQDSLGDMEDQRKELEKKLTKLKNKIRNFNKKIYEIEERKDKADRWGGYLKLKEWEKKGLQLFDKKTQSYPDRTGKEYRINLIEKDPPSDGKIKSTLNWIKENKKLIDEYAIYYKEGIKHNYISIKIEGSESKYTDIDQGIENLNREIPELELEIETLKEKQQRKEDRKLFIPGKKLLNQAILQTRESRKNIFSNLNPIKDDLGEIRNIFLDINSENEEEKRFVLQDKVHDLGGDWQRSKRKIILDVREMEAVCRGIFPPETNFSETFFLYVKEVIREVDNHFGRLNTLLEDDNSKLGDQKTSFEKIEEGFITLGRQVDFKNGFWMEQSAKQDERIERVNKGIKEANKLGILKDRDAGRDKYEELRDKYKVKQDLYRANVKAVKTILEQDILKLDDNLFQEKFMISKDHARNLLENYEEQDKKFDEIWEKYGASDYITDWIGKYDRNSESRVEALLEMGDFADVTETVEEAEEQVTKMKKWLNEYKNVESGRTRLKVTAFSIYDIYRVITESFEKHNMNWKRDSDKAVSEIGATILGTGNNFLGKIGQRWSQAAEESENQRVQEYETQYESKDGWVIQRVLYRTKDKDEARACINLLSKKGFLRWDDPKLWETLNRLRGGKAHFNIKEDMKLSSLEIQGKVESACEIIWTRDYFRQWDGELEANIKRERESFNHEFSIYENDPDARTAILSDMLKRWSRGETEGIDPARFEGFLFESFRLGKMNGMADQRWYFFVMGVATVNPRTGQSLLSRDVLMRINGEFLARFPHVDFLADKSCYKLNGEIVPEGTSGAQERPWGYEDYLEWAKMIGDGEGTYDPRSGSAETGIKKFFFQVVDMSPYAQDRAARMQRFSEQEGDHDDAWAPFLDWNQRQAFRQLVTKSEGSEKNSPDWWRTFLSTFPEYMTQMQEYLAEGDRKWKGISGWEKAGGMKDQVLKKVGSRLKMAVSVTQALLGNYVDYDNSARCTIFGEEEWDKPKTPYSPSLQDSKKEINKFMLDVFDLSGDPDARSKYEEILNYKGYERGIFTKEILAQEKEKEEGSEEHRAKQRISAELLMSTEKNKNFFENTTVIKEALKKYRPSR